MFYLPDISAKINSLCPSMFTMVPSLFNAKLSCDDDTLELIRSVIINPNVDVKDTLLKHDIHLEDLDEYSQYTLQTFNTIKLPYCAILLISKWVMASDDSDRKATMIPHIDTIKEKAWDEVLHRTCLSGIIHNPPVPDNTLIPTDHLSFNPLLKVLATDTDLFSTGIHSTHDIINALSLTLAIRKDNNWPYAKQYDVQGCIDMNAVISIIDTMVLTLEPGLSKIDTFLKSASVLIFILSSLQTGDLGKTWYASTLSITNLLRDMSVLLSRHEERSLKEYSNNMLTIASLMSETTTRE